MLGKLSQATTTCLTATACLTAAAFLVLGCSDKGPSDTFSADIKGLPAAEPTPTLQVNDGDTVRLTVGYVAKVIAGKKVRMLAYNRSVPGPIIKAPQGAAITLVLTNQADIPTTLHSHGVRLDYRHDGVPNVDVPAIGSGKSFAYHIRFPDPGIFWYHPHFREDYQMELGLYGAYLVTPKDSSYWPPVHREVVLLFDDILMDGKGLVPFSRAQTDHAMMGRFGNVFLVNGDADYTLRVKRNEVIRFYAVNVSSARVYNLQFSPDMHLTVIGSDNGRYEFPSNRESDILPPSERLIFQVHFHDEFGIYGPAELLNVPLVAPGGPLLKHNSLFRIAFEDSVTTDLSGSNASVQSPEVAASIDPFRPYFNKVPDQEVLLTGYMDMSRVAATKMAAAKSSAAQHDPDVINKLGIEWNDSIHGDAMLAMNRQSNAGNMRWAIRDRKTGKENMDIHWVFKQGDKVLIRIVNDSTKTSPNPNMMMHAMPHPIHFHGQRFLVVKENGKLPGGGLMWKDTFLIGSGFTVDILLDASNLGDWMFHCHIAEHLQSSMMGHFSVVEDPGSLKTPFDWSLGLKFADAAYDSLRLESDLTSEALGTVTGKVNRFDPAILDAAITLQNAGVPELKVVAPLAADGSFSFQAADLLGEAAGRIGLKVFVNVRNPDYRPVPDTLRLGLDRRISFAWSLDLNLADEVTFRALRGDTTVETPLQGDISGTVNGYSSARVRDTLYFRNREYPELFADAPLDAQGKFRFPADDLVGTLDGTHTLSIFLIPKSSRDRPAPDTIRVLLGRTSGTSRR